MSSHPRVALYIVFDSLERDLIDRIRSLPLAADALVLASDEVAKASSRLERREGVSTDAADHLSLLPGLDLGEKYSVLMRHRNLLDHSAREYYEAKKDAFEKAIPVRNAVMHGRPLTTIEFAIGMAIANDFVSNPAYWPILTTATTRYQEDPSKFYETSISILDDEASGEALNNLPAPDYEDTGFLPRADLEKDLRKKILGRYPVITVLGDGGNGKTALTLQTLYGLLASNDHSFDAIVWVSAKANRLSGAEVERIEGAITTSLGLLTDIADQFEPGSDPPIVRVRRLMDDNCILLVIDNLETVLDDTLRELAADIPGNSKLVFTSRVPLGSDLSVQVGEFNEREARGYLRRIIDAYGIQSLSKKSNDQLDRYALRLGRKPLLLKWFALGVAKGLDPDSITSNPKIAFQFCMENVIERLSDDAKTIASALAAIASSLSAPLIQEITSFDPVTVERNLAELLQFGLVQRDEKAKTERVYSLRGFARSYITKVLEIPAEFSSEVVRKLRAVESVFQMERGGQAFNRYDTRAFTVRNRSEALATRKLKEAMSLAYKGNVIDAETILESLRIHNSDYFEFHRVDAMVARRAGDVPRAGSAYEAALEIAESQPQLHAFYAGFLTRDMADYPLASEHLDRALELDPDVPYLLQEAARNAFFAYNFPKAKDLLLRAGAGPAKTKRDETIFADLNTQLHQREAEYLFRSGHIDGAICALSALTDHLNATALRLFDEKHLDHVLKAHRTISEIRNKGFGGHDDTLDKLLTAIDRVQSEATPGRGVPWDIGQGQHVGRLREVGRTASFGFLRNGSGEDCYVSRASVGEVVWTALCDGARATYEVVIGPIGKPQATGVEIL